MSPVKQEKAPTPKQLFEQQPDPLSATPEQVELFLAAVQNRCEFTTQTSERARLRREAVSQIELAGLRVRKDRRSALDTLNRAFRLGRVPSSPLDGSYRGLLVTSALSPLFDKFANSVTSAWLPWQGKRFSAANQSGDNIIEASARKAASLLLPSYDGITATSEGDLVGFKFRTYAGVGRVDGDRHTLTLDYDLEDNPKVMRRIVDEIVEVVPGVYLGKMLFKSRKGFRLVAWFAITDSPDPTLGI